MSCPADPASTGILRRRSQGARSRVLSAPVLAALCGSLCLWPAAAAAQFDLGLGAGPRPWFDLRNVFTELRIQPSVSAGITYTDNVDFEAEGEEDFIVFLRPRVSLIARARRLNTAIDYAVSLEYSTEEEGFRIEQVGDSELRSANTFEIVDNILFLDANASISRELIDNTVTTAAGIDSEQTDNFATVQRYLLSPLLRWEFGDLVVSRTRATLGFVNSGDAGDGWIQTYGASQSFASGPDFTTFLWSWDTDYLVSSEIGGEEGDDGDDDDEFTRFTTELGGEVVVTRQFSLLSNVGYDEFDDESLDDDPDGLFWNVGFAASPNRRLFFQALVGRRFDQTDYSFDLNYQISPLSIFQASFARSLETRETVFLNDLSFLGFDEQGQFVDLRTGLPFEEDIELFGLEDEVFFRDRFDANLVLLRERNTFTFNAVYEQRELTAIEGDDDTETVYGGGARWTRRLSRDMTGTLSLDYRFTDFGGADAGREDNLVTFRSGLTRDLGQGFSGSINYAFRRQFSTIDEEDISENAVSLTVTKSF